MKALIEQLHGEATLKRSALRLPGGEETLARVLAGKGYRRALEIGTYRGCSTAAIAQHVEHVTTIDLRHGIVEREGGFDRLAFWDSLGIKNISFVQVTDDADKALVVDALDFDFAFIDGGHDEVSVRRDFGMVRRCGRVLFHDYDTSERPGLRHVYDLVNALPSGEVEIFDNFAMWSAA